MKPISLPLRFFLNMAKIQAVLTRRFDAGLGGLGFSDFMILFHLSQAPDEKMRRIDLADKIGLTASGVTRLLAPMEKVGLIKRETNTHDARVSYVMLAPGGRRRFQETLERAELLAEEIFPTAQGTKLKGVCEVFKQLGGSIK